MLRGQVWPVHLHAPKADRPVSRAPARPRARPRPRRRGGRGGARAAAHPERRRLRCGRRALEGAARAHVGHAARGAGGARAGRGGRVGFVGLMVYSVRTYAHNESALIVSLLFTPPDPRTRD